MNGGSGDGPRFEEHRLGPLQSGMLFHALSRPGAGFDLEQVHIELGEKVRGALFQAAWNIVAGRHAALATCFRWDDGEADQHVLSDPTVPWAVEEWPLELAARHRSRALFLERDRQAGFDLRRGPLMRVTAIAVAGELVEVVWTYHDIILDPVSAATVLHQVFACYRALSKGETPSAAIKAVPYGRYLEWLATQDRSVSQQFFRDLLAGKLAATPLPAAEAETRPLPRAGYGTQVRASTRELARAVHGLAARTATSLRTIVHAAWSLVLARYTGEHDVMFGAVRSVRGSLPGELRDVVGPLVNALPTRVQVGDDIGLRDLLADVHRRDGELLHHEHLPLFEIERQAELPHGSRLWSTSLSVHDWELNAWLRAGDDPAWRRRLCTTYTQGASPLHVMVSDGEQLELRLSFERARFTESASERLLLSLLFVLEQFARGGDVMVGELSAVPPDQALRIEREWNDTARLFSDASLIQQPFESRVEAQPAAPAVEGPSGTLSYAELDRRANAVARTLRARGAGPGKFVGVCLSRDIQLVVAVLGVAKSGAAYVPLDPQYPAERLATMLTDCGAALVVTERAREHLFPAVATLCVDRDEGSVGPNDGPPQGTGAKASDVCCVFFTSGSTGSPNGVAVSHRALMNTLEWVRSTFDIASTDRLLFVTSPCFDLSVFDIFGVLGAGGTVVVASETLLADPAALSRQLVERRITVWNSAPAALTRLVPFLPPAQDAERSLRLVLLSGDWIPLALPGVIRTVFPRAKIVSLGGATEAAIWSNWFPVERVDPRWMSIPYGKPIQNCQYHVLDQRRRLVPVGVAGDLYIGGVCLAEGYVNKPALTAERFVGEPGRRIYKTGDLARYLEDGNLELLGRLDFQVKVRGFRVELGEVEAALRACEGVSEAVCAGDRDQSGERSLEGYVVPRPGHHLDPSELRRRLADKLPSYMIPSRITVLPELPISSTGKIDRRALRPLAGATLADTTVAPRNARERDIAAIWEALLERPVGINEDFFELGGHSLLAVLLVARLKEQLGIDVSLERLVARPTIEALSEVSSASDAESSGRLIIMNASGRRPPLVFFPGLYGTLFIYREITKSFGPDQPVYLARPVGADESEGVLDLTIEEIARIYETELLALRPSGPVILGGFSFGALVAFELLHALRARGHDVPLFISFDGGAPQYPRFVPLPARVTAHVRHFLDADQRGRRQYLQKRLRNLMRRYYRALDREYELSPEAPLSATTEMRARHRRLWQLSMRALQKYRPPHREAGPMLLFRATIPDNAIGVERDPLYGWSRHVQGDISVVDVPGSHETFFHGDNQRMIADAIAVRVQKLMDGGS